MMLTREDIDILLDALPEWEAKGSLAMLTGNMIAAIGAKTEEDKQRVLQENKRHREEQLVEMKQRRETSIILQAKLIQLRDKVDIERLIN